MRSRKVLPSFTGRRDLAFSRPMEVPRPPLSLRTAVLERSDWGHGGRGGGGRRGEGRKRRRRGVRAQRKGRKEEEKEEERRRTTTTTTKR